MALSHKGSYGGGRFEMEPCFFLISRVTSTAKEDSKMHLLGRRMLDRCVELSSSFISLQVAPNVGPECL